MGGNCDRHDVCIDHGYTGYNHKNSGGRPGDQTQVTVRGSEDENPWWLCAERCYNGPHKYCTGWTFAYDGAPHAKSYKCYLKWGPAGPVPTWSYDPHVTTLLPPICWQLQLRLDGEERRRRPFRRQVLLRVPREEPSVYGLRSSSQFMQWLRVL